MEDESQPDVMTGDEITTQELEDIINEVDALDAEGTEQTRDDEQLIPDTESIVSPTDEEEDSDKVASHPLTPTPPTEELPTTESPSLTPLADPLSMENEDQQSLMMIAELTKLKTELANAHASIFRLKTDVENLNELKPVADQFIAISGGSHDPLSWFQALKADDADRAQKATHKNNELVKKIHHLEKERNDSVMKNAIVEKRILDSSRKTEESTKESAKAKANEEKMKTEADKCRKIAAQASKECAIMKEQFVSNSNVLRWTQDKLKLETHALEVEREKSAKLLRDIKDSKEETEQIRNNTQQIIATYQNSEEVRSNALEGELKSLKFKYEELLVDNNQKTERLSQVETSFAKMHSEFDDASAKALARISQVTCLEEEKGQLEQERNAMARTLNGQKEDLTELGAKYAQEQTLLKDVTAERDSLLEEVSGAKERATDRQNQAETLKVREAELLNSVRTLTEANAELRQEVEIKSNRCDVLEKVNTEHVELIEQHSKVADALKELRSEYELEKEGSVGELSASKKAAEDAVSRVKALEKQNQAIKKELRTAIRKNESDGELTRSSSRMSLDSIDQGRTSAEPASPAPSRTQSPRPRASRVNGLDDYGLSNIDKKELIHRLVENQKINVKRNEKLDFLNDHVCQLTEELKKKTKLIQSFMVREQHGRMKPPGAEQELVQRVNKLLSGIYVPASDNLDVVLEVNKKLQLVLEDTLLKNMMQQDNIKLLGEEIDRQYSSCRCKPNRMHR